jgi:hypothetical protein
MRVSITYYGGRSYGNDCSLGDCFLSVSSSEDSTYLHGRYEYAPGRGGFQGKATVHSFSIRMSRENAREFANAILAQLDGQLGKTAHTVLKV